MGRVARRRSSGRSVAVMAAVVALAACGGSSAPSASVDSTAAAAGTAASSAASAAPSSPASSAASSSPAATSESCASPAPSGSTDSSVAASAGASAPSADVTLGGATQESAAPGASSSTAAPAATVPIDASTPTGYVRAQDPEGLVSVAAPATWTFLTLDDKMLQDLANNAADAVPEASRGQMAAAVASAGDYMKILGIGPALAEGVPSVNVIVSPVSVPVSVLRQLYPKQLAQAGSTVKCIAEIDVSGRAALEADVTVATKQGSVHSNQVVIPVTGKTIIISITGVDAATLATMLDAIVVPPGS